MKPIRIFLLSLTIFGGLNSGLYAGDSTEKEEPQERRLYEWSFVYHYVHIKTSAGNTYDIHSPGFNYTYRNGWRLPILMSATFFVPFGISYDGVWYNHLEDSYDSRRGLDFILAAELGGKIGREWRWRLAPGWSVNGISMPGEIGYYPFQSFTSGPAMLMGMDKDWEQGLTVRITGSITWQLIDFIHSANALKSGLTAHIGIGIGFRKGSFMGEYSDEK